MQPNEPEVRESRPETQRSDHPQSLNVLLVIGDLGFGGAERQVLMLANGLVRLGHNPHIAIFSHVAPLATDLVEPERLHVLPGRSLWALAALARRIQAQVMHGFLIDAEILCCLAARIVPGAVAIGSERSSRHSYAWWQDLMYRLCTTNMDACIANSDEGLRWHSTHYRRARAAYRVVRNGIDSSRFTPGSGIAVRTALGIGPDALLVGMFASFKPVKNHAVLLNATAELLRRGLDVWLLLAGDSVTRGGPGSRLESSRIESQIAALRIDSRVITTGHRNDTQALYRACDVTVLPSLYEGTPNVVLESLACGVPAIVADVPGCREVATLCPSIRTFKFNDVDHLVSLLTNVHAQRHRLADLGRLGRDQVLAHYGEARMINAMLTVYREVLDLG